MSSRVEGRILPDKRIQRGRILKYVWFYSQKYIINIYIYITTFKLTKLYRIINNLPFPPLLSMSCHLSWNSNWGDSSDCGSAGCSGLRCQEEVQCDGEATYQLAQHAQYAQHAIHAFNVIHAQPAKLQVRCSQKKKDTKDGYCCQKCNIWNVYFP